MAHRQTHVGPVEPLGLESLRESDEDHCRGSSSRRLDRLVQQLSGGIPVLAAPGDEGDLRAGVGGLRQPPRINAAAAGALVPHVPGHMADEHHRRLLVQGQQVPVVLQQHGALRRRPAGQGVVDLHVRRRSGPAGLHRPVHQRQDPAGAPVQVGAVQGPGLRRPAAGPRHIAGAAGHHQVAPRPKGGDSVRDATPVGDHRAVKAPLLPENVRQELPVLGAVDAVDLVVGAHHGGRAALPDHDLKGGEIELPQGPLIQHAVGGEALVLLAVAGEVFHAGPRPGGLEPPDPGGPQLPRQKRVLGEVLKIAAAQGAALEVHPRPQHQVNALSHGLLADGPANVGEQRLVPGAGRGHGGGEAGGGNSRVHPQHVAGLFLLAQTVGAVGHGQGGELLIRQVPGVPEVRPLAQGDFFFC